MLTLAELLGRAGRQKEAEEIAQRLQELAQQFADTHAISMATLLLARLQEKADNQEGAEATLRRAADAGNVVAMLRLSRLREAAGDRKETEELARRAAETGNTDALLRLTELLEKAGDSNGAETSLRRAADAGNTDVLLPLAELLERAGKQEEVEELAQQAADTRSERAHVGWGQLFTRLWPHGLDPDGSPTSPWP